MGFFLFECLMRIYYMGAESDDLRLEEKRSELFFGELI